MSTSLPSEQKTDYEKNQSFNKMVASLHGVRYKNILNVFDTLSQTITDRPIKVVEIGCAYGKLYTLLNARYNIDFIGIEVEPVFIEAARSRHGHQQNFQLVPASATESQTFMQAADVIVALETLEHIPEHDVVRLVETIAAAKPSWFICSVPVEVGPSVWFKNVGSWISGYMRHKEYTWPETFWAGLYQLDKLPPHGTGHKGFDWRWLAQTIRHHMSIQETRRFPCRFLPAGFAFSVFMIAKPRPAALAAQ